MDFGVLEEKFIKMINTFNKLETLNVNFVPDIKVSHIDIHILVLMFNNPDKKVSELSLLFGVTKGAFSQHIKKLEKRDLLKRVRHNDNYKEVFIELTDLGKQAVEGHNKYECCILENFETLLSKTTEEQRQFLTMVMDSLTKGFEDAEESIEKKHLV